MGAHILRSWILVLGLPVLVLSAAALHAAPPSSSSPSSLSTQPSSSPAAAADKSASGTQLLIALTEAQAQAAGLRWQRASAASSGEALRLQGTVVPAPRATEIVAAPVAGVVQALLVQPMQSLPAGTVILRLHSPQFLEWQREYVQQQLQDKLAADKLERDQALHAEGIISRARLEETRAMRLQAQAALSERKQMLLLAGMSESQIKRLVSAAQITPDLALQTKGGGSLLELSVTPGQRVEAGAPLARVGQASALVLELAATQEQARLILPGASVRVEGCPVEGRVLALASQVNAGSQMVTVRASLPASACVRANQFVQAQLQPAAAGLGSGSGSAAGASPVRVPLSALLRHQGREWIFLKAAGGARPLPVQVLSRGEDYAVLASPLPAKAEFAVTGLAVLKGMWLGMGQSQGGK